jgi:hypothetical protein
MDNLIISSSLLRRSDIYCTDLSRCLLRRLSRPQDMRLRLLTAARTRRTCHLVTHSRTVQAKHCLNSVIDCLPSCPTPSRGASTRVRIRVRFRGRFHTRFECKPDKDPILYLAAPITMVCIHISAKQNQKINLPDTFGRKSYTESYADS